jgi:hypothetical protein
MHNAQLVRVHIFDSTGDSEYHAGFPSRIELKAAFDQFRVMDRIEQTTNSEIHRETENSRSREIPREHPKNRRMVTSAPNLHFAKTRPIPFLVDAPNNLDCAGRGHTMHDGSPSDDSSTPSFVDESSVWIERHMLPSAWQVMEEATSIHQRTRAILHVSRLPPPLVLPQIPIPSRPCRGE